MSGRRLRSLLALVAFAAGLARLVQALRGEQTATFATGSRHPVLGAATPEDPAVDAMPDAGPAAGTVTEADLEPGPVEPDPVDVALAVAEAPTPLFADERIAAVEPVAVPAPEPLPTDEPAVATAWVDPVDGACPDGYPVKAKVKSGIFHLPGMAFYDRTTPDRCYPTPDAATADGLRPAKR